MKRIIFLLIGIFIFACGCNDDILPADAALENENLKSAKTEYLPIKGEAFISFDEYDAQGLGVKGKMSGVLSHFGKLDEMQSTWENMSRDFSQYPPFIAFIQNIALCAANGDFVYATYSGLLDVRTLEVNGSMVFESGTGRFENVLGQVTANGYAESDETGRLIGIYLAGEGEISNVGSSQ